MREGGLAPPPSARPRLLTGRRGPCRLGSPLPALLADTASPFAPAPDGLPTRVPPPVTVVTRMILSERIVVATPAPPQPCAPGDLGPGEEVVVGAVLPLSRMGTLASGLSLQASLMLAREDINGAGGIAGHPVRVALRDADTPERAARAAGELIAGECAVALVGGYHSDLTRTIVLGRADEKQRDVYRAVLDAQLSALAVLRPGVAGKDADQVARDLITARGYGENFGHGLGHGLGRQVHDGGGLSPRIEITLQPGMVMTVEPGVYIEGWGGVRIEDDVVLRDGGVEILTHAPKQLIEVPG